MSKTSCTIRSATVADVPLILRFIRDLAEYERLAHEVVADEDDLRRTLFGERPAAEVLLAETADGPVGFALFFTNYSTFQGRPGLYLEDLYISEDMRGNGIGEALLRRLAALAVERGYGRFEWAVLDWNESAHRFYHALGAHSMDEWTVWRVDGEALLKLAEEER